MYNPRNSPALGCAKVHFFNVVFCFLIHAAQVGLGKGDVPWKDQLRVLL